MKSAVHVSHQQLG